MKNYRKIFWLLSTVMILMVSCSKDDFNYKSDGEINGEKITALCQKEQIKTASTYLVYTHNGYSDSTSDEWNEGFAIEGQIIKVGETYYNLNKLVKYQLYTYKEDKILLLFFDGQFDHPEF